MLVDSSIVVLESIFNLTTAAVSLPIVFVEGIAGQLFRDMALTVTIGPLASLLVALTPAPMLSALGREKSMRALPGEGTLLSLGWFSRGYDRILRSSLLRRDPRRSSATTG
jgi:multidrug efflux pump subunit AcrB